MALTNFLPKCSSLLKPTVQQVSLRTSMKTSAPLQGFLDFFRPKYMKPEYDEEGELGFPKDDDLATGMWKKELEWRNAGVKFLLVVDDILARYFGVVYTRMLAADVDDTVAKKLKYPFFLCVYTFVADIPVYFHHEWDPFCIGAISRGDKGSKLDPIMVPGSFESRTIGCKCHDEQHLILLMWLHQGEPKRCRCGFWYVLYYKEPISDFTIPQ